MSVCRILKMPLNSLKTTYFNQNHAFMIDWTADLRCIQCHVNYMTLDTPKLIFFLGYDLQISSSPGCGSTTSLAASGSPSSSSPASTSPSPAPSPPGTSRGRNRPSAFPSSWASRTSYGINVMIPTLDPDSESDFQLFGNSSYGLRSSKKP